MASALSRLGAVGLLVLVLATAAVAQQPPAKMPRIGVLMYTELTDAYREALRQGLRERGYVEGQNILIEWRAAGGRKERAASLAAELVQLEIDVIVATLSPAVQAAKSATASIPIIMAPAGDPVGQGFIASLGRPGGNVTGVTGLSAELSGKRIQLLRDLNPGLTRIGVLLDPEDLFAKPFLLENETAAKNAGLKVHVERVRRPHELEAAFAAMAKERSTAVIVQPGLVVPAARAARVAKVALSHHLPTASQSSDFPESGGLLSYGVSFTDLVRRAAVYVDQVLKGARPGELAVEQPTRFELVVNLRTAKALKLVVPHSVRLQADRVIE